MKGGLIGGVFGLFLGLIFSFELTGSYLVITISFLIISSVIGAILFGLLNIPKWMKHGLIGMFFLIPVSYIIWGFFDGGFLPDFCRQIWDSKVYKIWTFLLIRCPKNGTILKTAFLKHKPFKHRVAKKT